MATIRRWGAGTILAVSLLLTGAAVFGVMPVFAQEELTRKVKNKVAPAYPDVARRMNITGTVKVLVVVLPNGGVKNSKVLGGHPLLVNAALDALKKWKFEPASEESTGVVEFKFQPE
jgi:protein TonB